MIHFGHNFSEEFEIRQDAGDSATVENIIRSKISINMDSTSKMTQTWFAVNLLISIFSDQIIHSSIKKWILESFEDFFKDFMKSCGHEPEAGFIPLEVSQLITLCMY